MAARAAASRGPLPGGTPPAAVSGPRPGERPGSPRRRREERGQRKRGGLRGRGRRPPGPGGGTSQSGRHPGPAPAHLVRVVGQLGDEVPDPAAVLVLVERAAAPTAAAGNRAPGRGSAQPPAHPDGAGPARQRRSGRRRRVQTVLAEGRRRQQLQEEEEVEAEAVGPAREAVRSSPGPLHRRRMPTPPTPAARRARPPPPAPRHTPESEPRAPWIRAAGPLRPHRLAACPSSPAHSSLARVASGFGGPGFGCQDAGLIGWNVAETAEVIPPIARRLWGRTSRVSP
ncbi:uncharacterized protein LOC132672819 [Panthera onca]